jgi:hypothetical protein
MVLPSYDFIRFFLTHVLAVVLHRIRHYGFFANGLCTANVVHARELITLRRLVQRGDDFEQASHYSRPCLENVPARQPANDAGTPQCRAIETPSIGDRSRGVVTSPWRFDKRGPRPRSPR